ncbi:MAG: bifunctional proline dehydrogenase/L-glutamate gamma-semialdehyde dehydrogenase PutA [Ectothiorhodospiraceae bacterium]|nr:bifunctional proline dehydrogenase/L-glutamate gamma-semialdehyde dehydrogenase PutA [Ectothiorhodospiraceae bacterium]
MIFEQPPAPRDPLRRAIDAHYRADETTCVHALLAALPSDPQADARIQARARALVETVRASDKGGLDAFLQEYGLSTREGVMLMCVAEALLRIPDDDTQEALIRDKLGGAEWARHLGHSDSLFVNASTWALMLTGRVVSLRGARGQSAGATLARLVARLGEPVIREAVWQAMRIMGRQFVMGRDIAEALDRARPMEADGYRYSYDMLGEAARTMADADRFFDAYRGAIAAVGEASGGRGPIAGPGVSVKLSALHPRYEPAQRARVMDELVPRLHALALDAARAGIGLTIDAEEAARLDLSLDVIDAVAGADDLRDWSGLGVVVQAYQKRAPFVIDWLADLAGRHRRRLMVRLVKGAYWDSEIKLAQEQALSGYPVFTRKVNTDVCYLACAARLLSRPDAFYPQFATHNAHTVAAVLELADGGHDFELQRLHGMGEDLYQALAGQAGAAAPCRIYAPVGEHEDLLAYLVRRLLENGANSSFVNRIRDDDLPIEEIIADPVARARASAFVPHPRIPLPVDLYGEGRRNFAGVDLTDHPTLAHLAEAMRESDATPWRAAPVIGGASVEAEPRLARSPADHERIVGEVVDARPEDVARALAIASDAAPAWDATPVTERAACLRELADRMEAQTADLVALAVREAGKTLADAVAEVREAVDFCRYYALRAEQTLETPQRLRWPADGTTAVRLAGSGVYCCISPWNFPLAIFTGQVAAALVAGNCVIAKPAEQTPLMAAAAVRLMHAAGIPGEVLHLLPGDGPTVGASLVADPRIGGVCFTGSTAVARIIERTLAARDAPPAPLIAETGGINAMLVDSSALPEQVVRDVVASAFQSAGQRCSALRLLLVQDDVAERIVDMLRGAMEELTVGDPAFLATDVGPVIDAEARDGIEAHIRRMRGEARLLRQVRPGPRTGDGTFVGPVAFELDRIERLDREIFGPVLHVVRYRADRLDAVIDAVNASGYGLTHGVHTRVDETRDRVLGRVRAGNLYVNRNQIGAVVGVQPFGGEGLSGTGPKAGGPHYLGRFVTWRADVAAASMAGGEAAPDALDLERPLLDRGEIEVALASATAAFETWASRPVAERADHLERAADALAARGDPELVRAADRLRVLAAQAEGELAGPLALPGPTGERNELVHAPLGVVVCLAAGEDAVVALTTEVAAALAAGNAVLAWHPEAAVAGRVVAALHDAGVPPEVVVALRAGGDATLADLASDPRVRAVAADGGWRALAGALAASTGAVRRLVAHAEHAPGRLLAGTPPAGSPEYLYRFLTERAISIDTTASGGNASLFSL